MATVNLKFSNSGIIKNINDDRSAGDLGMTKTELKEA